MKSEWVLGASTLGAPGETVTTVLEWLSRAGATAVELRVGAGQPVTVDTPAGERLLVRKQFAAAGIDMLAVASYVRIGEDLSDDEVVRDVIDHLELAADLGARFLRVFPGVPARPGPSDEVPQILSGRERADRLLVTRLAAVTDAARDLRVRPALETHDSHPRGEDVARVLRALEDVSPASPVGAIWDVLHPFRVGENPHLTWELIGGYLRAGRGYVQIKDASSRSAPTPVLLGQGVIPLVQILDVLRGGGYRGPLSLEWERAWHPQIEPLPRALAAVNDWLNEHRER